AGLARRAGRGISLGPPIALTGPKLAARAKADNPAMAKCRWWVLLTLAAWLWHAPALGRKLVLAATEYPPYYSESLDKGGPVAELTVAALRRAGYEVELRFMPWARALKWGEQGK